MGRPEEQKKRDVDEVARLNVLKSVNDVTETSDTLRRLVGDGTIAVVGAMYDVTTGAVEFVTEPLPKPEAVEAAE